MNTAQKLLDRANRNTAGVVVVITGFITTRKNKRYGSREHGAAVALVNAGKLRFVRSDRGVQHMQNGADHYTNHVFEIVR